ncbi:hypothetical protein F2Q70_00014746 [Brassica cretica]|uniref:DUF1985 domain-containing protein n=1 Tax=Brassica cretica TaxID=69181 RepID=A0A8S9I5M7_BRACR|nr:hypothetical protein F2Q70_00014746 [Brassica cretica]
MMRVVVGGIRDNDLKESVSPARSVYLWLFDFLVRRTDFAFLFHRQTSPVLDTRFPVHRQTPNGRPLAFLFVAPISLICFTDKPHQFLILASRFTDKLLMEDNACDTRLPERLFATDRFPRNRLNIYSRPNILAFVRHVLHGSEAFAKIRKSSFGKLFDLPTRQCPVSYLADELEHDHQMDEWRRIWLALIIILDGVLIASQQIHRPTQRYVQMLDDVDAFLEFPWGRESFLHTLRVTPLIPVIRGPHTGWGVWPNDKTYDKVTYMEQLIANNHCFSKAMWPGGDCSEPVFTFTPIPEKPVHKKHTVPRKRKESTLKPHKAGKETSVPTDQRRSTRLQASSKPTPAPSNELLEARISTLEANATVMAARITGLGASNERLKQKLHRKRKRSRATSLLPQFVVAHRRRSAPQAPQTNDLPGDDHHDSPNSKRRKTKQVSDGILGSGFSILSQYRAQHCASRRIDFKNHVFTDHLSVDHPSADQKSSPHHYPGPHSPKPLS